MLMEKKMTEHYEFVNNPDPKKMSHVRLLKSPYAGVEYAYGNVAPKIIDGEPIVSFIFEVYVNPTTIDVENDPQFKNLISEILHEILSVSFRDYG